MFILSAELSRSRTLALMLAPFQCTAPSPEQTVVVGLVRMKLHFTNGRPMGRKEVMGFALPKLDRRNRVLLHISLCVLGGVFCQANDCHLVAG